MDTAKSISVNDRASKIATLAIICATLVAVCTLFIG